MDGYSPDAYMADSGVTSGDAAGTAGTAMPASTDGASGTETAMADTSSGPSSGTTAKHLYGGWADTIDVPQAWTPQPDSPDPSLPDVAIRFSTDVIGFVYKNTDPSQEGDWLWDLLRNGELIAAGFTWTRDQAMRTVETEGPKYGPAAIVARKKDRMKRTAQTKARIWVTATSINEDQFLDWLWNTDAGNAALVAYQTGAREITCSNLRESAEEFDFTSDRGVALRLVDFNEVVAELKIDMADMASFDHVAAAYTTKMALHIVAGDFPPKDDEEDDSEDDEDQTEPPETEGGDTGDGPPVGEPVPNQGADPQNPTKDAPPVAEDPSMDDPNAAVAPVPGEEALPVSTDPMDRAQATLEAQVEAVNALGHDAMETAYDVDELFSEWRCMNCEAEGRGDISEDGQVAFSGDLLQEPQGCTMPTQAIPGQVPVENNVAPETNGEIPGQDQEITQGVQARKRKFLRNPFRRSAGATEMETELNDTRPEIDSDSTEDAHMIAESKVRMLTESILASNPGMNAKAARKVAVETIRKFPSVVGR